MVTEITAFAADDGNLFGTKLAALEHDAVERLKKLRIFNHASAMEIVSRCLEVGEILQPLVDEKLSSQNRSCSEHLVEELESETHSNA